jgi:hypothetical protein
MKLKELLEVENIQYSMTLQELEVALRTAQGLSPVQQSASLTTSVTALLTLLTVYNTIIQFYVTLNAMMPAIKLATKMAGIPLNPALATEVAQDGLLLAQKTVIEKAKDGVLLAKNSLLDMDVPGTA